LFVHGREAYRKNSYLIAYNFYKNVVFVFPIFWYGIFSLYSGDTLYNPLLYNNYNIFFTSLPIIWFAVMDFEYSKEELLSDPKYYKIGFKDEEFNRFVFWRWILYGVV
jgi:magnesium-transporting ATPase (P-type)